MGIMPMVKRFRDLDVYKGAMSQVMEIFALSKGFPPDERFASDRENGSIKQIAG